MDNYTQNLNSIRLCDEKLFAALSNIKENREVEVFQGATMVDINMLHVASSEFIYSKPAEDNSKFLNSLSECEKHPILYCYGIGNGLSYFKLLQNKEHSKIIVFEPVLEVIFIALHFYDFSHDIASGRFVIVYSDFADSATTLQLSADPNYLLFATLYNLHVHSNFYYNVFSDDIKEINKKVTKGIRHNVYGQGNYAFDNIRGVKQYIQNIPQMLVNIPFQQMADAKPLTKAAVLVGLGPSLDKQLPTLKRIQKNVTIITVEAVVPLLEKEGITPDLVTSLERSEIVADFMKEVSDAFQKHIIYVVAAVVRDDVIRNIAGQKVVAQRGFHFEKVFELDAWGYLGVGMGASNMAYELATKIGYEAIILIGQDLAYGEDGASHSEGNIKGADQLSGEFESDSYVLRYGGEGTIRANYSWNLFREYFEKDIIAYPSSVCINSTEGGSRIEGSVEMTFEEAIATYVDCETKKSAFNLRRAPDDVIVENLKKAHAIVTDMVAYATMKKEEAEAVLERLRNFLKSVDVISKKQRVKKVDWTLASGILSEVQAVRAWLGDDAKFQHYFFETIRSDVLALELEIQPINVKMYKDENEHKLLVLEWLYKNEKWLHTVAGLLHVFSEAIGNVLPLFEENRDEVLKTLSHPE